ncbi:lipoyl protein ligase domain-containing protein [Lacticaseibacillus sp. GG6-2]
MQLRDFTAEQPIGLLSQHFTPDHNLDSFAYTNAFLRRPVALPPVFAHFWTLEHTVILGMQDLRMPELEAGLTALGDWHYFIRNSGGLGVVTDDQVLNFSLFLPASDLSIAAAYQLMADLIAASLPEVTVTTGEITRSYCPGTYDLSINGQKFAGIAQRRTSQGIAIMAYLSVCGDQTARGRLMQDFYTNGKATTAPKFHYPVVDPRSMNSLDTLLALPLTVGLLQSRLVHVLEGQGVVDPLALTTALQQPGFEPALATARSDMQERQEALHA